VIDRGNCGDSNIPVAIRSLGTGALDRHARFARRLAAPRRDGHFAIAPAVRRLRFLRSLRRPGRPISFQLTRLCIAAPPSNPFNARRNGITRKISVIISFLWLPVSYRLCHSFPAAINTFRYGSHDPLFSGKVSTTSLPKRLNSQPAPIILRELYLVLSLSVSLSLSLSSPLLA